MNDSRTRQEHQHARPLLTDAEAMQLPPAVVVVQVAGAPPIYGRKAPCYDNRAWNRLTKIPAPRQEVRHG